MTSKLITLRKNKPFYQAGRRFGWKGAGLGIDDYILTNNNYYDILEFVIGPKKRKYYISIDKARKLATSNYNSYCMVRGQYVWVIPFFEVTPEIPKVEQQLQLV